MEGAGTRLAHIWRTCWREMAKAACSDLRLQCEFAGKKTMVLAHRRFGSLNDVSKQLRAIGKGSSATVEMKNAFSIDEE